MSEEIMPAQSGCSDDELWDAYDRSGRPLGYDLRRGDWNGKAMPENVYHLVVQIFVFSADEKVLVTQRAPCKSFPLQWENPGGSVLKGETPVQGAVRELREETGLCITPQQLRFAYKEIGCSAIYHCFAALVRGDETITLQEGETVAFQWLPYPEFLALLKTENFINSCGERALSYQQDVEAAWAALRAGQDNP